MKITQTLADALKWLKQGEVVAYPTEAVYGIGCNPFDRSAVEKLLALKQREAEKGLIVLIANWQQLSPLIQPLPHALLAKVEATWPGPVTWLFPKADTIPFWLTGHYSTLAIRMSAHPIAHAICGEGPVVSTSANRTNQPPAKDLTALQAHFPQGLDGVLLGDLGGLEQPSRIYDVLTQKRLR